MIRAVTVLCAISGIAAGSSAQPVFEDGTSALPFEHIYSGGWEHFVGGGVSVFDCNGDAWPDMFVAGGENPASLFVNTTADPLQFVRGTLLPDLTGVTGAYPIDIDSDGHIDIAVLRVGANVLLRGDGNCGFVDAGKDWAFHSAERWTTAFSATWEPDQEWPTLAFGNYVDRENPDGPFEACDVNTLYRHTGDGYSDPRILEPGFCALSILFSDWRRTGAADLRISNDRHYYVRGGYEQMWSLSPLREFTEKDGWNRVSIWGMGIASADLENDGFPDVMLTSMGDQLLQFNTNGTLNNAEFSRGTTAHRPHIGDDGRPSTGWHAEFGDVDNDGRADLFIAKGNVDQMPSNAMRDPNNLLMQDAGGSFNEVAATAGIATVERSRGAAMADLNMDGRLDIVVMNRRAPIEIWLNATEAAGNWATVDLEMPGTNKFAIGAWLEIERENGSEWRERTIGGGHVSGSLLPMHIGLGAATSINVRVNWPDGTAEEWQTIEAGQRATIAPSDR